MVVELHPPMLKIGQNWGQIANYPPNAQYKSVPLVSFFCQNKSTARYSESNNKKKVQMERFPKFKKPTKVFAQFYLQPLRNVIVQ